MRIWPTFIIIRILIQRQGEVTAVMHDLIKISFNMILNIENPSRHGATGQRDCLKVFWPLLSSPKALAISTAHRFTVSPSDRGFFALASSRETA